MQANFPLASREQQISFWYFQFRRSRGRCFLKPQYSKCWENHLKTRRQYCVILFNNSVKADNKESTRLAWSTFLVVFTTVPWQINNKIWSHIPSYMLLKVQIGCPLHLHLPLSLVSVGFILISLLLLPPLVFPVELLLWVLFSLPVVDWETWSFPFLPSPAVAPVSGLGTSQMLVVKRGPRIRTCPSSSGQSSHFSKHCGTLTEWVVFALSKGRGSLRCYYI